MKLPPALIFVKTPNYSDDWVKERYKGLMRILVRELRDLIGLSDIGVLSMHAATTEWRSDIAADAMVGQTRITRFKKGSVKLTAELLTIESMLSDISSDDEIPIFVTPKAWRYAANLMEQEVYKESPMTHVEPPLLSDKPQDIGQALIVIPGMKLCKLVSLSATSR